MKRFIRYLYEYEQGRRTRNVGFVKVEQSDSECIVHIHGKGLRMGGRQKLRLYLFFEEGNECLGLLQGEIDNINPSVNYRLRFTPEDTGVPENYPRIAGILMENDGHRKYAAMWDDMPINVENVREWTLEREQDETPAEQTDPISEVPRTIVIDDDDRGPILPRREEERESERREETSDSRPYKVMKIQRKDLARLPRCEWRLSNNSFLLHGYYNYKHLVFIQDGRRMRLGVPGIYHEKEAKAAEAFGFPEFISADNMNIALSKEECNEEETFGYWCRQVRYLF